MRWFYALLMLLMASSAPANIIVAPHLVIVVSPSSPRILSSTPLGGIVASVTVSYGSIPFTGTLTFGTPDFDHGGVYAISGTANPFRIIVNPSGPGVSGEHNNIDNITLVATQ